MPIRWQNGGDSTAVDIRIGGPGNNWAVLDPFGMIDAATGGGRAVTRLWSRGENGGLQPRGFFYSSNPNAYTFKVSYPLKAENFLKSLSCPFDIRARQRCDRPDDLIDYSAPGIIGFNEVINTNYSYSAPIASMDGVSADVQQAVAADAVRRELYTLLAHDDVRGTVSDFALTKVISVSPDVCPGQCPGTSTEDMFWAVSKQDNTPGYTGNATARFYYRLNAAAGWASVPIDPFTLADATDVIRMGPYVVVFSSTKAPAYALFQDILNGVTAPNLWSTASGFAGITGSNFPRAAFAVNSSKAYAVGAGGRIWSSTTTGAPNGPIAWTLLYDTGTLTSQNLTALDGVEDLMYIGGAAGTFIRLVKDQGSVIVVKDSAGNVLSSNINTVDSPSDRTKEVHLGTAGGEIWRSTNATDTKPVFTNMNFTRKGTGSITDLKSIGYRGDVMFIVQTDVNGLSRVLRDFSGGAYGGDVEIIGDFNTPSNFGINSIAPANVNYAFTVGNVSSGYAFIGTVRPTY